ncbi:pectate lyase [Isoptericola jiangsuensis]|uniref:Pectate lyase n=1 Tax=Isoptericola jiangsuensis TaxID=548579 RepID=A0A2A9ET63_9MICO|nr:polysaccharide lyase family 1 protein [Isoptericola jiangsuensis]PFG41452.1 pectate lyase [Isoptericola jiangsuensis]
MPHQATPHPTATGPAVRRRGRLAIATAVLTAGALAAPLGPAAQAAPDDLSAVHDLAQDAAPTGWATANGGTDGGAGAPASSTYVVSTRAELLAALDNGGQRTAPKVIYVDGVIDGNERADGTLMGEQDYAPGYDLEKYLSCFTETGWSDATHDYCGDQRRKRQTGSNNLKRQTEISVPSETTILGVGDDAEIRGATVMLHLAHDVVVRNLTVEAPRDFFSSWDPWDGEQGSWNARFDAVSSVTSTNIWLDHVTLTDGRFPDSTAPTGPNGKPVNFHDGLFDLKDGTDFVTMSNSRVEDHDKAMLIGSGDDNGDTDEGRLNVTFVRNVFDGVTQRSPRVRFGKAHVVNNYFTASVKDPVSPVRPGAGYFIGVGVESQVVSERNLFEYTGPGADASRLVWGAGGSFVDSGSWFAMQPVDLRATLPAEITWGVDWDPADVYDLEVLTSPAAVKAWGKHRTGAILPVQAPSDAVVPAVS